MPIAALILTPAGIALAILLIWLRPLATARLRSQPQPLASFAAAQAQIAAQQAAERADPRIGPAGYSRLRSHGRRTERAIVFIHGMTNCPEQFERLGAIFYERGYNVLIPRMPHHGLADRLTAALAGLTAEELVAFGDRAVDLAHGLGERVTVVGISAGANLVAWLAQERADIDLAVLIAPMFSVLDLPASAVRPVASLALLLPNRFLWWDSERKDAPGGGPHYAYPRFATRAIGEFLRLGYRVRLSARRAAPAARRILAVTNPVDPAVNNAGLARVARLWRRRRPDALREYSFPTELRLIHDIIDPNQAAARIDAVYPVLIKLIES